MYKINQFFLRELYLFEMIRKMLSNTQFEGKMEDKKTERKNTQHSTDK